MRSINLNPPCSVRGALTILLAFLLAPAGSVVQLFAHEFEDGHVERSVSFVVQDRKVFVEYAVGCNINTMTALLNQWQAKPGKEAGPNTQSTGSRSHLVPALNTVQT